MTWMHMLVGIMMSSKKRQDGNRSLLPFKGSLKAPERLNVNRDEGKVHVVQVVRDSQISDNLNLQTP